MLTFGELIHNIVVMLQHKCCKIHEHDTELVQKLLYVCLECTGFSFRFSGLAVYAFLGMLLCLSSRRRGRTEGGLAIVRERIIIIFEQW